MRRPGNGLEATWPNLPAFVQLHPNLYASEYHLFSAFEVDAQLHDISIVDWEWPRFGPWGAESYMVEKCSRRAFHIFNEPAATSTPKFAMAPADNL